MANQKIKIVIDTNVWLSGLVFGGQPGRLLQLFAQNCVTVVASEELLSELRRKITVKFPLYMPQLDLLEASLRRDAEMVGLGNHTISVCRDRDDDKFIETAIAGNCQYIVSGDKDLLDIKTYQAVQIVQPATFLQLIYQQNN